jgi:hypothetical protein
MKYKYRCTSRFPVLLEIEGSLMTIRPNQVIETSEPLSYDLLKEIKEPKPRMGKPRTGKPRKKTEVKNGKNNNS